MCVHMYVFVCKGQKSASVVFNLFLLYCFETRFLTESEFTDLALLAAQQDTEVLLCLPSKPGFLMWVLGIELTSLFLLSKHFTHQAIDCLNSLC